MKYSKKPIILSLLAIIGVGATACLAVRDSKKVQEAERFSVSDYANPPTKQEQVLRKVKCYVPTIISGLSTVSLILMSNAEHHKQYVALGTVCIAAENALRQYRYEVAGRYGNEVDKDIIATIAADKAEKVNIYADTAFGTCCSGLDIDNLHEQELVFFDNYSNRFFKSTFGRVLQAEYHLNRNFQLCGTVMLNDFYEFLGIDKTEQGDHIGWGQNLWNDGICWIDFNHIKNTRTDGTEYFVIDIPFGPSVDFEEDYC